jgi:perosamine synthetase
MAIPLLKVRMPETAHPALGPVLASGYLADGAQVREFEQLLRDYVGNPHMTAMSDISGAITLALYMAGVRPGDEVLTSPMLCTATSMPIANLFARPVWCDVDPLTGMLDPAQIAERITGKTKAVLVYHWGGDVAQLDQINAVAHAHGVKTIDDAADGLGAEFQGRRLGNNGCDFTAYSFQAVKHITTGEGAALFFADAGEAEKAQWLKRYGIHRPSFKLPNGDLNPDSDIPVAGYNFYLDNLAATIGIEQFRNIEALVERYRENGRFYDQALQGISGVRLVKRFPDTVPASWTYNLLVERRSDLVTKLKEHGIASQRLHVRNDLYSCFTGVRVTLPGVDYFDSHNLSIPCGWWVTPADRDFIVQCISRGW